MLKFFNPGEIDPRLITTLGVNVKDNDSAIGFFGTGLKYAIACCLRQHNSIEIHSGLRRFQFEIEPDTIRGKEFQFINMVEAAKPPLRLGFTTDFGKTWEPWMVYRELMTNAIDEYGDVEQVEGIAAPRASWTSIYVTGLDEVHAKRAETFLGARQPIATGPGLEVYEHSPGTVYYRGVRVHKIDGVVEFSYNLTDRLDLTEDRTMKYQWMLGEIISRGIVGCGNRQIMTRFILPMADSYEKGINWAGAPDNEIFDGLVSDLFKSNAGRMNRSLWVRVERAKAKTGPKVLQMSQVEAKQLAKAIVFLHQTIGIDPTGFEIVLAENLGKGVMGLAKAKTMYIAREAFQQGTKRLAGTVFEEWAHLEHGFADYSQEFQNWLIDKVMSLGEEKAGEPL